MERDYSNQVDELDVIMEDLKQSNARQNSEDYIAERDSFLLDGPAYNFGVHETKLEPFGAVSDLFTFNPAAPTGMFHTQSFEHMNPEGANLKTIALPQPDAMNSIYEWMDLTSEQKSQAFKPAQEAVSNGDRENLVSRKFEPNDFLNLSPECMQQAVGTVVPRGCVPDNMKYSNHPEQERAEIVAKLSDVNALRGDLERNHDLHGLVKHADIQEKENEKEMKDNQSDALRIHGSPQSRPTMTSVLSSSVPNGENGKVFLCAICDETFVSKELLEHHVARHCMAGDTNKPENDHDEEDEEILEEELSFALDDSFSLDDEDYVPNIWQKPKKLGSQGSTDRSGSESSTELLSNWRGKKSKKTRRSSGKRAQNKTLLCTICKEMFTTNQSLERHRLGHKIGTLSCDVCGIRFTSKRGVTIHKKKKHPEAYSAIMEKRARSCPGVSNGVVKRRKVQGKDTSNICGVCGIRSRSPRSHSQHMLQHGYSVTSPLHSSHVKSCREE